MAALVTVIIAYDLKFYDKLPRLFPHFPAGKCESCEQEFFPPARFVFIRSTAAKERLRPSLAPEGHVKSNFLCNIGYSDPATLWPRGPRLDYSEACTLL